MKFRSKIGWWFHLVVLLLIAVPIWNIVLYVQDNPSASLAVFIIFVSIDILFILPIYFYTVYTLEGTALHIRCGLFISIRIPYSDIKGIHESRDPSSSLALSFDRIEIWRTSNGSYTLISPKDKQEFIRLLTERVEKARA